MLPRAEAIPMAVATWIAYLCVHFVLVPGWFAWRYRRSPYALRWLPRNAYDLGESTYGLLVVGYTLAVLLGPPPEPRWTVLAVAYVIAGSALILGSLAHTRSHFGVYGTPGSGSISHGLHIVSSHDAQSRRPLQRTFTPWSLKKSRQRRGR